MPHMGLFKNWICTALRIVMNEDIGFRIIDIGKYLRAERLLSNGLVWKIAFTQAIENLWTTHKRLKENYRIHDK